MKAAKKLRFEPAEIDGKPAPIRILYRCQFTLRIDEPGTFGSSNGFTVPNEPGPLTIWVVVRDDRGGVGYREITLPVTP